MDQGHEAIAQVLGSGRPDPDADRRRNRDDATEASGPTPDFASVEIDSTKITAYVMNPDHPVGGNKYRVINSVTGLGTDDATRIDHQIRDGVLDGTPIKGKVDLYGERWAVDVLLTGPRGSITVRTAWILEAGSTIPRLVTISFP